MFRRHAELQGKFFIRVTHPRYRSEPLLAIKEISKKSIKFVGASWGSAISEPFGPHSLTRLPHEHVADRHAPVQRIEQLHHASSIPDEISLNFWEDEFLTVHVRKQFAKGLCTMFRHRDSP